MPIFRIYNVVDENNKVVKIGSTIKSLEVRVGGEPYRSEKYKNCRLELRRKFQETDRVWGDILRYVREQFDISRAKTWYDQNGWNIDEPVHGFVNGYASLDAACVGAKIAGQKNKQSGHAHRLGKEWGKKTGILNLRRWISSDENKNQLAVIRTPEHQKRAGQAAGKVARDRGQIQTLGKIMGPTVGAANLRKHLKKEELTGFARLKSYLTPEHQRKAASAAGRVAKETGQIQNLGKIYGAKYGPQNLKRWNQTAEAKAHLKSLRTPEHQQNAAWAGAHKRFHKNKINSKCPHCQESNKETLNAA